MFHISFNMGFVRKKREMTDVVCSHCGRGYRTNIANLRVPNYCNNCK